MLLATNVRLWVRIGLAASVSVREAFWLQTLLQFFMQRGGCLLGARFFFNAAWLRGCGSAQGPLR